MTREAEVRRVWSQIKEGWQPPEAGEGKEQVCPQKLQRGHAALPTSWFQISDFQNGERVNFCSKLPVCGNALQQPQKTDTFHTHSAPPTPTSLLFLEHSKHTPVSQLLKQLFILGCCSPSCMYTELFHLLQTFVQVVCKHHLVKMCFPLLWLKTAAHLWLYYFFEALIL